MANAIAKLYYTQQKYLDSLPVNNGNIIFVPDSHKVCLDLRDTRYIYQTILELETEAQMFNLESPVEGFYFVAATNMIWRYNNGWSRITPPNLDPIIYGDTEEDFPEEGKENTLYYTDEGIFNWKNSLNKYNLIANANRWDSI